MGRPRLVDVLLTVLAAAALAGASGCAYGPVHHRPVARYVHPPFYYDYYYYPHADVYFHIYSGDYYYRGPRGWTRVRKLPSRIHIDHRYRVPVRVRDKKPYSHHREHRDRFRYTIKYPYPKHKKPERKWDRAERRHNERRHDEYRERRELLKRREGRERRDQRERRR